MKDFNLELHFKGDLIRVEHFLDRVRYQLNHNNLSKARDICTDNCVAFNDIIKFL